MPAPQPTTLLSSRTRTGLRRVGLLLGLILGALVGFLLLISFELSARTSSGWGSSLLGAVATVVLPALACAFGLGLVLPWGEQRERGQQAQRLGKWVSALGIEPLVCISARLLDQERERGVLCLSARGADFVWQSVEGAALLPLARGRWLGEERPLPEPTSGWLGRLQHLERREGRCWGYGELSVFVSEGADVERWAEEQSTPQEIAEDPERAWVTLTPPASEAGAIAALLNPWALEGLGRSLGLGIVLEELSAAAVALAASIGLAWLEGRARLLERTRRAYLIPVFALLAFLAATLTFAQALYAQHAPAVGPRAALGTTLGELFLQNQGRVAGRLLYSAAPEPALILAIVWTALAVLGLGLLRERRLLAVCLGLWFGVLPLLAVALIFAADPLLLLAIQIAAGVALTFPFALGAGRLARSLHPYLQLALAGQHFMSFEPSEVVGLIKEGLKRPS